MQWVRILIDTACYMYTYVLIRVPSTNNMKNKPGGCRASSWSSGNRTIAAALPPVGSWCSGIRRRTRCCEVHRLDSAGRRIEFWSAGTRLSWTSNWTYWSVEGPSCRNRKKRSHTRKTRSRCLRRPQIGLAWSSGFVFLHNVHLLLVFHTVHGPSSLKRTLLHNLTHLHIRLELLKVC